MILLLLVTFFMFCDYIEFLHIGIEMLRPQLYNWYGNREESVSIHKFPKDAVLLQKCFLEYPEKTGLEQNNAVCFLHALYGSESHFRKNGFQ